MFAVINLTRKDHRSPSRSDVLETDSTEDSGGGDMVIVLNATEAAIFATVNSDTNRDTLLKNIAAHSVGYILAWLLWIKRSSFVPGLFCHRKDIKGVCCLLCSLP